MLTDKNNAPRTVDGLEQTALWKLALKDFESTCIRDNKTNEEEFYHNVFVKLYNITETIKTLDLIINFLRDIILYDTDTNNFNKLLKAKYHIENFFPRLTKVNDQILLLTNTIYNFNIEEHKCEYKLVVSKLKSSLGTENILEYLESSREAFKQLNMKRNKIVHREKFQDVEFVNLSAMAFLNYSIKSNIDLYIENKVEELEKLKQMSLNWAFWASVLLVKPYNERKNELENK